MRTIPIELEGSIDGPHLYKIGQGLLGDRLRAVQTRPGFVVFVVALPSDPADQTTCEAIATGSAEIALTASPASPNAGDNVAVQIGEAAGDYTWAWRLNGEVIDDSDASGVATVGDYVIDVTSIESGVHEVEVRKPGMYGYLRIEVD